MGKIDYPSVMATWRVVERALLWEEGHIIVDRVVCRDDGGREKLYYAIQTTLPAHFDLLDQASYDEFMRTFLNQ